MNRFIGFLFIFIFHVSCSPSLEKIQKTNDEAVARTVSAQVAIQEIVAQTMTSILRPTQKSLSTPDPTKPQISVQEYREKQLEGRRKLKSFIEDARINKFQTFEELKMVYINQEKLICEMTEMPAPSDEYLMMYLALMHNACEKMHEFNQYFGNEILNELNDLNATERSEKLDVSEKILMEAIGTFDEALPFLFK